MPATKFPNLLSPLNLGEFTMKNRVVMASLTRNRGFVPNDVMKEYYVQRANAGLILTEGTLISQQGSEWPEAPGIFNEDQIKAWKEITDAVHDAGGLIFCQIWHIGRAAHPEAPVQKATGKPVPAPSAIAAKGGSFRHIGIEGGYVTPTAIEDPKVFVKEYRRAAESAKVAGFDGIELHAANGYLVAQFIEDHSNKRTDEYGGSVENRNRFAIEILKEFIDVWGPKRVGIKLSPSGGYNDMGLGDEGRVKAQYTPLIEACNSMGLAYIQLMKFAADMDPQFEGKGKYRGVEMDVLGAFEHLITNTVIFGNMNYEAEIAEKEIAEGKIAAAVFGRKYINNPDLALRFAHGKELNKDMKSRALYSIIDGDRRIGYADYPTAVES